MHFHEDAAFVATIDSVSQRTGCPAALVEKDYWLTAILRSLSNSKHAGHCVFKGGTSLWKAFKLIDRFSEDIDLLLDDSKFATTSSRKSELSRIRQFLDTIPNVQAVKEPPWFQGEDHATFVYGYDAQRAGDGGTNYRAGKVIVEIGFRGGISPNARLKLNSMIGESAAEQGAEVPPDLENFEMLVLAPERTFIEKLYAIDDAVRRGFIAQRTRHFYDVHKLFGTRQIKQFLRSDELPRLSEEVRSKTQQYYGDQGTPSLKDLAASGAFELTGEYYSKIEQGYKNDHVLYYRDAIPFGEIANSIRDLLTQLSKLK